MRVKRITLLLAGALFTFLFTVGLSCSLLGGVSELGDIDEQKKFIEEVAAEYEELDSFSMTGSAVIEGEDMDMTFKVAGDDMEIKMSSDTYSMNIVVLGDYSYFGTEDTMLKMKNEDAEDYTSEFTGIEDQFTEEVFNFEDTDWDEDRIKYEGLEDVDGVTCHKFSTTEDGETSYIWFDAKKKLMVKVEGTMDGEEMSVVFSYDDVTVEEPENAEDISNLSEEEQAMKLMEVFTAMMGQ